LITLLLPSINPISAGHDYSSVCFLSCNKSHQYQQHSRCNNNSYRFNNMFDAALCAILNIISGGLIYGEITVLVRHHQIMHHISASRFAHASSQALAGLAAAT
jgi:hypothetical protein